jgi:ABC-type branched-subunit amino acid transport system substrate-binding protein
VTPNSILIGELISQTGAVGSTIGPIKLGYDAWIKTWNARGGTCGRKITTTSADTQGNSGTNASAARDLVESSKVFAIAEGDPLAAAGSSSYLQSQGVPVVGVDSANNVWFQTPVMFPIGNQYNGTAAMGAWAFKQKRATKFAVMWENIQVSSEGCKATLDELKKLGAPVVYTANVPVGTPDLSSYVTQAKQAGADGIVQCFEVSAGVALMKALQKQNWHPYVGAVSGSADDSLLKAAPANVLEGVEVNFPVPAWTATNLPGIQEYNKAMTAAYGPNHKNSVWTVRGFTAAWLLTTALEQMGPKVTRKDLMTWLNKQTVKSIAKINPGLGGLLPIDTTWIPGSGGTHVESQCSQEWRIHNGAFVPASQGWFCLNTA